MLNREKIEAIILILIIIAILIFGFFLFSQNPQQQWQKNNSVLLDQKIKLEFETLELATTNVERQTGYMNRETICTKCGMMFIFENEQPLSFWMKNTLVPLKITFIDQEGRVLNTGLGQPKVTNPPVRSTSPAKYVLEVPVDSPIDLRSGQEIDIQDMISKGVGHTTVRKGENIK